MAMINLFLSSMVLITQLKSCRLLVLMSIHLIQSYGFLPFLFCFVSIRLKCGGSNCWIRSFPETRKSSRNVRRVWVLTIAEEILSNLIIHLLRAYQRLAAFVHVSGIKDMGNCIIGHIKSGIR